MDNQQNLPQLHAKRQVSLSTFALTVAIVIAVSFIAGTRSQGLIGTINRTFGTTIDSGVTIDLAQAQEAYRMVHDHYDGNIDVSTLADGAAHGLTDSVGDPHTVYFNAQEAEDYKKELSGSLSGIGAEIGVRNSQPTILRVLDDSPAKESGLAIGDVIVAVDDTTTKNSSAFDTAKLIRGDAGTEVKLTIERGKATEKFNITRAEVTDPSVSSRIDGTIGVITIRRFDTDTGNQARMAARTLVSKGATSFILDLRDNGGGYLNQAQSVAGLWLSDKLVVSERHGDIQTDALNSTGDAVLEGKPTVVLINGGSASASEVVAGALKDHKVATLIGEKSFGKGTVQKIFDLSGGNQIKITIAHWLTPDGNSIDKKGITPDTTVKFSAEEMDKGKDPQMQAAFKKLR